MEVDKKQSLIEGLSQANRDKSRQIRNNAIVTSVITLLVLILAVMIIVMYRAGKRCRRSRELLALEQEKTAIMNMELADALHIKNRLMAIVAHDLRGPVGGLMQLVEVYSIMKDMSAEDVNRLLKNLKESTTSVYYLLDNLLLWANNQNGEDRFNPVHQNVVPVIGAAVDDVKGWALLKNIEIDFSGDSRIDALVDDNMLKTIVRNLISNSIKFSKQNSKIQVVARHTDAEFIVSVADSGEGMSDEMVSYLFEDDGASQPITEGKRHGFGLIVCRDFVKRHNGQINATSELRKGTTVWFSIPLN